MAVKCAQHTLQHVDFYQSNKKKYFEIKAYMIQQLSNIVPNNPHLIDFIMKDGVYLIIICNDPVHLQTYFNHHGVSVRSKHSDLKGSVRITLSTYESMNKVCELLTSYSC